MRKTFYEKKGRKYVPVSEYDSDLVYGLPEGSHLVVVLPGKRCTRYNVDPAYAPMIAAGINAEEAIRDAITEASTAKIPEPKKPLTEKQSAMWRALINELGPQARLLKYDSVYGCVQAGIDAMVKDANETLKNPAVKKAYEHFLMVYELTKEHK